VSPWAKRSNALCHKALVQSFMPLKSLQRRFPQVLGKAHRTQGVRESAFTYFTKAFLFIGEVFLKNFFLVPLEVECLEFRLVHLFLLFLSVFKM